MLRFVLHHFKMSFFDHLRKPGSLAIKPQGSQIRKEVIRPSPDSAFQRRTTFPSKGSISSSLKIPRQLNGSPRSKEIGLKRTLDESKSLKPGKNKSRKRPSPVQQRLQSSSEGSDSEEFIGISRKKARSCRSAEPDVRRRVRSQKAFSEDDGLFDMVHAADIASLDKPNKFTPAFDASARSAEILLLQYPSASQQERYEIHREGEQLYQLTIG